MQMMTSLVLKKPEISRRFVSDKLFDKLQEQIKSEPKFVYNRLYLNHVTSFDYYRDKGKDNIVIALKRSTQSIRNIDSSPVFESSIISRNEILILSRDAGAGKPLGSLYAHSCPNCGAPVKDTIELNCTYCHAQLNSTKFEWIISEWMDANEYEEFKKSGVASLTVNKNIDDLDDLFSVRDYALNNVLMMIASDGKITEEETEYVNKLAKKWNYDLNKIQGFLALAKSNKLVVRMPQNPKQKQKIISLMEKAANLDNTITEEEKALLDKVKEI